MKPAQIPSRRRSIAFTNEIAIAHDGWAQLARLVITPAGIIRQADGSVQKFPAIQRLDRAAADLMVVRFKSPAAREALLHRLPIYAGIRMFPLRE